MAPQRDARADGVYGEPLRPAPGSAKAGAGGALSGFPPAQLLPAGAATEGYLPGFQIRLRGRLPPRDQGQAARAARLYCRRDRAGRWARLCRFGPCARQGLGCPQRPGMDRQEFKPAHQRGGVFLFYRRAHPRPRPGARRPRYRPLRHLHGLPRRLPDPGDRAALCG